MPIISNRSELNVEQRQKLIAAIAEAENRGLPIAEELRKYQQSKIRKWTTDANGYFPRKDGHIFRPYGEQEDFVKGKSRFSLFIGGRGSGKSASGAQKALAKIQQGYNGAVFNPHFENFKTSTWIEFREWIPWDYVITEHKYRSDSSWQPQKPFILKFENGSTVQCKGLKDESSARGPNINWLWYDESQDDEDGLGWTTAIASVRVGKNPQAWCTATGRGTYHWMYEFFVEQRFPEEVLKVIEELAQETGSDVPFINWYHGSIFDNKDNVDPGFMAAILTANPVGYRNKQEVYGEFADPGGNLGDPSWFKDRIIDEPPKKVKNRVRYWDLAASEKKIAGPSNKKLTDPDSTCGTLLSYFIDENLSGQYKNQFVIEHQVSGQWKWERIKDEILKVAEEDGPTVPIYIEEEPGSGGINQVAQIKLEVRQKFPQHTVREHNPKDSGDKIVRANIWFAEACQTEAHPIRQFWMVRGDWNKEFLKQLSGFPTMKHDDIIDSVSGARINCAPIYKWRKQKFLSLSTSFDKEEETENTV